MGLTRSHNTAGFSGRLFGVAQGAFAPGMISILNNRAIFGSITSIPQGYTDPLKSIRMTVVVSGMISARFIPEADMIADLKAFGSMAALFAADADMIANGNVGFNGYALFDGEFDMVALASAIGSMNANMDLIARPSANDIAQEVWNARVTAFQTAGTLGKSLSSAEAAAKLGAALSA
jgi:hypothetical protein